jgi:hypothetical protein
LGRAVYHATVSRPGLFDLSRNLRRFSTKVEDGPPERLESA